MSDPATNTTTPQDIPGGTPAPAGLKFTADQAMSLGIADAEPGAYYSVRIRVSDNNEGGVTAEPLSAEPAQDEPETMGDPDASMEGMEIPPPAAPRPKPTRRNPSEMNLGKVGL